LQTSGKSGRSMVDSRNELSNAICTRIALGKLARSIPKLGALY